MFILAVMVVAHCIFSIRKIAWPRCIRVYLVPQAEIGFERAIYCGASFTEAVETALRNESFFSRNRLQDELAL